MALIRFSSKISDITKYENILDRYLLVEGIAHHRHTKETCCSTRYISTNGNTLFFYTAVFNST